MCGIAGIFHYGEPDRPIDRKLLETMTRILAHRGPDGEGFYVDRNLGFGHRRLSIVDLTQTGNQPMCNEDRSCCITYNGELFNHTAYRERLGSRGYRFRGTSDTETLLKMMEEYGPDSLAGATGIFAFAFWEAKKRRLTLARDHLGVKQVYYHDDGSRIVFASEIKALLACPEIAREVDLEGLNQYLHFHTTLFDRTMFKGIRQLRAGEYLQVTRWGARLVNYWSVDDFQPRGGTPEQNVEQLRERLSEVVADQLMSDVPVGCFFSGGIDSSAIATYARRDTALIECFGLHFTDQGVPDERPYQEAAAKALGLSLELTTLDGAQFPDDLTKLIYHQDQPVIGPAMFPMYQVSKLAARKVKVCLGGQGGDEIFGGYARYALANPARVIQSWFTRDSARSSPGAAEVSVGGNLRRQLLEPHTFRRVAKSVSSLWDWESAYFNNFATIPEALWQHVLAEPEMANRHQCRELFHEVIARSPGVDAADKAMHWDIQAYLPGLFHQDDRMSMAASLESRVPLADPRVVQFAMNTRFSLKFRGGASKWILRKTLSDVLPDWILNRRKVGFDTPVEHWIRNQHAGFVRELLFSQAARSRGLWNMRGIEGLLQNPQAPNWFNPVWKVICLEAWARTFLDRPALRAADESVPYHCKSLDSSSGSMYGSKNGRIRLRDYVKEVSEDGPLRMSRRIVWEVKVRSGIAAITVDGGRKSQGVDQLAPRPPLFRLFANPRDVAVAMKDRISHDDVVRQHRLASDATRGKILSFGSWIADYGHPIDWHRNPHNGNRWSVDAPWTRALRSESWIGDVKLNWEPARFPHFYLLARAAVFTPEALDEFTTCMLDQVRNFIATNPTGRGLHWNSSQEIVFRQIAWLFALGAVDQLGQNTDQVASMLADHALQCALHIDNNNEYARKFVYNNHLLSEALGLYLAPSTASFSPRLEGWMQKGKSLLELEADRQIYPDGAYIQQSHNYHRVAMQVYLLASAVARARGEAIIPKWQAAMERSLDFLLAQGNPLDGRLPNYGSNDGALPCILSSCDFSDFRPTLQALSVQVRGERIFEPGPWDEEACWLLGPTALEAPIRSRKLTSVSFRHNGYHVLRGREASNFVTFRCGDLLDRFSQMDMLHLDVWWRGQNVLVDGGSYLYNGQEAWHSHFISSASHNTVRVDGRDQMVHLRQFKLIYRTKAKVLQFQDEDDWALCTGEHYGFRQYAGKCVHRRSVFFLKDDLWIVADRVEGQGTHRAQLHWLGGPYPFRVNSHERVALELDTPSGAFRVSIFDSSGNPLKGEVVAGQSDPPRGWLSRYYGSKVAVPSLTVDAFGPLPTTIVSILSPYVPVVYAAGNLWSVSAGERKIEFELAEQGINARAAQEVPEFIA